MTLRIGTRGSPLALFQANAVSALLRTRAGTDSEIVVIRTSGDRLSDAPLSEAGGKRLFVKEIEDALLAGEVDLAVHSSKDMPVALPDGLAIGATLPREDPRDAVVLPVGDRGETSGVSLDALLARLGDAPRIGTSSVRRTAQLARLFPRARFLPIRGNLDTRLRKLDEGGYDAIVLASAGLIRLEQRARISTPLPTTTCIPAPGQGIIAIEVRADDPGVIARVARIDDDVSRIALDAERAVVERLGGGCQMPIGAFATVADGLVELIAIVLSLDGTQVLHAESRGPMKEAMTVGHTVAEQLRAQGADTILAAIANTDTTLKGRSS